MEEEKIQNPKVENGEVVQTQQSLNVATDLQNKKLTKKDMFIAGLVFFGLVVAMFIAISCMRIYIMWLINSAESGNEEIAVATALIIFIPILLIMLAPMLAFFITSLVLLVKAKKSTNPKISLTSKICVWIDVALFVASIAIVILWILTSR